MKLAGIDMTNYNRLSLGETSPFPIPEPVWQTADQVETYLGIPTYLTRALADKGVCGSRKLPGASNARRLFEFAPLREWVEQLPDPRKKETI